MQLAATMASIARVARRCFSYLLPLVLAVSTLSAISVVNPQTASADTSGTGNCQQNYTIASGTGSVVVTESGGYCYVAFKNTGAVNTQTSFSWTRPADVTVVSDVLIVAGGGGGGAHVGGGGGAGGLIQLQNQSVASTVSILVGAGGREAYTETGADVEHYSGGTLVESWAFSGRNSKFGTTEATGGGRGGLWWNGATGNGLAASGGSGGGAVNQTDQTTSGGAGTANQGSAGGTVNGATSGFYFTGGGGGAGAEGGSVAATGATKSGDGGAGREVSWLNSVSQTLSVGQFSSSKTYFAGGGGGGYHSLNANNPRGLGGIGGGGNGAGPTVAGQTVYGGSGTATTGGGGGGSGAPSASTYRSLGGNGGSGVVVLRYTTCSPTISSSGGFRTEVFSTVGGCNWIVPSGVTSAEVLVVGGGGGGNSGRCSISYGAGGGGGGVSLSTLGSAEGFTPGAIISVIVGAGGLRASLVCNGVTVLDEGVPPSRNGTNGGNSSFGSVSVNGGQTPDYTKFKGGTSGNSFEGATIGDSPDNCSAFANNCGAGGGGGAQNVGSGLNGGAGVTTSISGTSTMYGGGGPGKDNATRGTSGDTKYLAESTATANSGGGGSHVTAGAAGVVIVRYAMATLTPTFGTPTATANGFTVQISNFNSGYTWSGTATASGNVSINDSGLVTVTGVAPGTSSTATITNTTGSYTGASATVSATSVTGAVLNPTFGTVTATVDGFTVPVTNYNGSYTWAGTATANGTASISNTGLVTVTGVAAGTSSTATITTTRTGYTSGSATVDGTSAASALMAYEPFTGTSNSNMSGTTGSGSSGLTGNWDVPNALKHDGGAATSGVFTSQSTFSIPTNSGFAVPASNTAASGSVYSLYYSARQLSTPINFGTSGTYYLSFISQVPGTGAPGPGSALAGLLSGLPTSTSDTGPWSLLFGSTYAHTFGIDYGYANRASWVSGQTRGSVTAGTAYSVSSSKSARPASDATHYFNVVKIVTAASGNDNVYLKSYLTSEVLPTSDPSSWDVAYAADIAGSATHMAVETEANGTIDEYRIGYTYKSVTDAKPTLSALVPSTGTLSPVFATGTTSYTATVANSVASITLTPTATDVGATTVQYLGETGTTVFTGTLNVGANIIRTIVTSQDGTSLYTYTVTVTRAGSSDATLSALTISSGTLSPSFTSGTTSYTANVSNLTTSVTLTPTVNEVNATTVQYLGATGTTSFTGALNVGANVIRVVVTAQNGTTSTYTVTVTRLTTCAPTEVRSGGFSYNAFKTVETCGWIPPVGVTTIDLLVVAGGGGGGATHASGGGAGGLISATGISGVDGSVIAVTVGDGGGGGTGVSSGGSDGSNGFDSVVSGGGITERVAIGGRKGSSGASTGGSAGPVNGGTANVGGAGSTNGQNYWVGGSGGGAGAAGSAASITGATAAARIAGVGGAGLEITWITTTARTGLGVGVESDSKVFFAGGGGGGSDSGGTQGAGGVGGGGAGSKTGLPVNGTLNTGSGGGGSGVKSGGGSYTGGTGGTGVVVIRYALPAITPTFGTATATATGFTVQISNFDAGYTWSGSATANGIVSINGTGLVTVTGVTGGTSSTATITNTTASYTGASQTVSATSLVATYTITFAAGTNGVGSNQTLTKTNGTALTLPDSSTANSYFTRAGFTVTGWSATSGGVQAYALGGSYTTESATSLYPVWTANSLIVSYESNGGTAVSNGAVDVGASISAAPTAPTKDGYTFSGWSLTDGGAVATFPLAHGKTANFSLYAIWSANSLTITYNSQGGTAVTSGSVNTGSNISAAPTAPTRIAYTFSGWSATASGSTVTFPYAHGQTSSFTLYAIWSANLCTAPTADTTSSPGYTILKFTNSSPCVWSNNTGKTDFDIALVGGGGAGGFQSQGAGGGAGQVVISNTGVTIDANQQVAIEIGAGGAYRSDSGPGSVGKKSSIYIDSTLIVAAQGGNGGAGGSTTNGPSSSDINGVGGSGGGGRGNTNPGASGGSTANTIEGATPSNWTGYANAGGGGAASKGGGGGGAGSSGFSGTSGTPGLGGTGISLWGSTSSTLKVAGGGAGYGSSSGGSAVSFGGGNASTSSVAGVCNPSTPCAGTADKGGGGGTNSAGGSGVVFIRYSNTYTITYNISTATSGAASASSSTYTSNSNGATLATGGTLEKTGYVFGGWSTSNGGAAVSNYKPTADVTLHIVWTPNSLVVSYDEQGGSTIADGAVNVGASISSAPTAPTKDGYSLAGWSTTSTGSVVTFPYAHGLSTGFTLYAIWTVNSLTVTFNSKGGTAVSNGAVNTGASISAAPTAPTKTGYTFAGWSASDGGSAVTFPYAHGQTAGFTLFARWSADALTITYDSKGGTSVSNGSTVTEGSIAVAPAAPTKANYTFAGWSATDGVGASAVTFPFTHAKTAAFTMYALWTANAYVLTYVYNSATSGNTTLTDNFTTGGTQIVLPTPTRTGYDFSGWYADALFVTSIGVGGASFGPTGSSLTPTAYAKWTGINRTVTYSASTATGGAVPTDANNYILGSSVVIKANSGSLVRTGYTFAGWTYASDGTGSVLTSGMTYTTATSNMVFYAKWSANTYTVTYNKNGASGSPTASTASYTTGGDAVSLTTVGTMAKTGFDFSGWSASPTGSALSGTYTTAVDVTLYAVWTIKNINITFSKGDASLSTFFNFPSNRSSNYGTTITLSDTVDSAVTIGGTSHAFMGWNDGTSVYQSGATYLLGETAPTFTAVWVKIFAVRYAFNGGTAAVGSSAVDAECLLAGATCSDGQVITANAAPSRAGYSFAGWVDQFNVPVTAGQTFTVRDNRYLIYANWTALDYSISYDTAGGSPAAATFTKQMGQTFVIAEAPTKVGYSFAGWNNGTTIFGAGVIYYVATSPVTLTAQWTPDVYTIVYDWNGGSGSTTNNGSFTVGSNAMSLPDVGDHVKDGYTFAGWSTSNNGTLISGGYTPTANSILYAIWGTGSYTITYNGNGGTVPVASASILNGSSLTLPTPTRDNFVFDGWFTDSTAGSLIGAAAAVFQPAQSRTLYAHWTQSSLYGLSPSVLSRVGVLTASDSGATTTTHENANSSVTVAIPAATLPAGTTINIDRVGELTRAQNAIAGNNSYIISVVVSWITSTGTVPNTNAGKAISVTITNASIKAGAKVYGIVAGNVTQLTTATQNGTVTVQLTSDPEVVVVATKPDAPTNLAVTSGAGQADLTWTAPSTDGGSEITGYTVTGTGGVTCTTTTTSCNISGLTAGTAYTFTVTATNALGTSVASTSAGATTTSMYVVTFDAKGGSNVANGGFLAASTVTAPTAPTKSGYTFGGWSATDGGAALTFPYAPGVTSDITLYAKWTQNAPVVVIPTPSVPNPTTPAVTQPENNITVLKPITVVGNKDAKLPEIQVVVPTTGLDPKLFAIKVDKANEKFIAEVKVVDEKIVLTPVIGFSGRKTVMVTITEYGVDRIIQVPLTVLPESVKPVLTPTSGNKSIIRWTASPNATKYSVYLSGKRVCPTASTTCSVPKVLGPDSKVEVIANGADRTFSEKVKAEFKQTNPVLITKIYSETLGKAKFTSLDLKKLDTVIAIAKNQGFRTIVISDITKTKKTEALAAARIAAIKKYIAEKTDPKKISVEVIPVASRTYFNNISLKG